MRLRVISTVEELDDLSSKRVWLYRCIGMGVLFVFVLLATVSQYVASYYSYDPALGQSLFGTLYSPHKALVWTYKLLPINALMLASAWLLGLSVSLAIVIGILLMAYVSSRSGNKSSGHGSARWADLQDIEQAGLINTPTNKTSLIVGGVQNSKTGNVDYLVHTGPESVLGYAPSRSGKGVSLVIPNLLCYEASAFVTDVKGELWNATAGYRREKLKQNVLFHNPSSQEYGNARFNVLDEIRVNDESAVRDAQQMVQYLIPSSSSGKSEDSSSNSEHFITSARSLLVGIILFELNSDIALNKRLETYRTLKCKMTIEVDSDEYDEELEKLESVGKRTTTVTSVLGSVTDPNTKFREYLSQMQQYSNDNCSYCDVIRQIGTEMQNRDDKEFDSVLSSMTNPLSIYRDPILARATSRSDFKLDDLVSGDMPMSLYLIISPSEKDRLKNYFGMLVNILCRKLTERTPDEVENKSHKLLLMLDEFSKLPPLPIVLDSLDLFAGYGIKAMIIAQDVQTILRLYGQHETIQSNCKVRIAFTPNKLETAEMLSKMIGASTVQEKTQNRQRKALSVIDSSVSEADGLHTRQLMTADEVMRLQVPILDVNERMIKPGGSLVFVTGCRAIKGIQTPYFMDEELAQRAKYPRPEVSDVITRNSDTPTQTMTNVVNLEKEAARLSSSIAS